MPDKPEWDDGKWRLKQPFHCFDCRADLELVDPAPMLKTEIWRSIGCGKYTLLCLKCVKQRIQERLSRPPSEDDLTDVPFNQRFGRAASTAHMAGDLNDLFARWDEQGHTPREVAYELLLAILHLFSTRTRWSHPAPAAEEWMQLANKIGRGSQKIRDGLRGHAQRKATSRPH